MDGEHVARALIAAFNAIDLGRMRSLLAGDLRAYITNREGRVDETVGADEYLRRIEAMDLPSAEFSTELRQAVTIRPDLVMVMVEVHAERGGRTLHNHAAHLFFLRDSRVAEWWMVEALRRRATPSGPHRSEVVAVSEHRLQLLAVDQAASTSTRW